MSREHHYHGTYGHWHEGGDDYHEHQAKVGSSDEPKAEEDGAGEEGTPGEEENDEGNEEGASEPTGDAGEPVDEAIVVEVSDVSDSKEKVEGDPSKPGDEPEKPHDVFPRRDRFRLGASSG